MKRTKTIALLSIILLLIVQVTCVYATDVPTGEFEANLTVDKQEAHRGDTIQVTFGIANISNIGEGIFGIEGDFEYDQNIFELVAQADFASETGWDAVAYNDEVDNIEFGKFAITRSAGHTTEDGNVFTVTLKIKEDAPLEETTIRITNILATDSSESVTTAEVATGVSVVAEDTGEPGNETGNETGNEIGNEIGNENQNSNIIINGGSNNVNTGNQIENNDVTDTTAPKELPQAGLASYIVPAIFVIALISFIAYLKYKKID